MPMADRMEDTGRRYSQLHASTSTIAQVGLQFDRPLHVPGSTGVLPACLPYPGSAGVSPMCRSVTQADSPFDARSQA
jgi:hypothetical protein